MASGVQLRKGVLELAILAVLDREECYSIEIIERLGVHPALVATPGTVYPLLARLDKGERSPPAGWRPEGGRRASTTGSPLRGGPR